MGIIRFTNVLKEILSQFIKQIKNKISPNYLFIDFNSLIYRIGYDLEENINNIIYQTIYKKELSEKSNKYINYLEQFLKINFSYETLDNYIKECEKKIDDIVLDKVYDFFINEMKLLVNINKIKILYIAIDEIPNFAKMIEQKKRRINSEIESSLKKKIFEKYKNEFDENRIKYENIKFKFNYRQIIHWSELMQKIKTFLENIHDDIKNQYKSLKKYIVSYSGGEAEKKIVNYIHNNKFKYYNFCVFSPDADVIILLMLLFDNKKSFTILKFDQQLREHFYVDVIVLINYIFTMIKSQDLKQLKDIAMLWNFFGNDFIPKIIYIDIQNNLQLIINIYIDVYNEIKENLIYDNGLVNMDFIKKYIENISKFETNLILNMIIKNKFINYKIVNKFLYNNLFFVKSYNQTISALNKLSRNQKLNEIETEIISFLKENNLLNENTLNKLKLKKKKNNYDDVYIKKELFGNKDIPITPYDRELLQLIKLTGKYKTIFTENFDKRIIYHNKNTLFIGINKENLYEFINKMRGFKTNNKLHEHVILSGKKYIEGFSWISYYYNNYNNIVSDWYYPYTSAPLLSQLIEFAKPNNIADTFKYNFDNFMTPTEHYCYINTYNTLKTNNDFKKILIGYNEKLFPNINKICDKIWYNLQNNINSSEILNCSNVIFLNKCELHIKYMDYYAFKKNINSIIDENKLEIKRENGEDYIFIF